VSVNKETVRADRVMQMAEFLKLVMSCSRIYYLNASLFDLEIIISC
jgi:hypothetical protein